MATQKSDSGGSLLEGIRNSPATERLMEAGRGVLDRQMDAIGDKLGGLTSRIGTMAETGHLPVAGKAAKNMAQGEGMGKSMLGAVTSAVTDKAKKLAGNGESAGGKSGKGGPTKAMNIEESIDVGVPVSTAYNQWTQFAEFSQFTKGVEHVEQKDDTEVVWRAKVFKSHRTWNAKIVEQIPDKRIVWTSDGPKGSTRGVVTFHPLGDELTRVLLAMEYYPQGAVERVGNIWRAAGRRARLDLKNYRRFVMLEHDATGEWRGEIHDGKVARQPGEESESGKATKPGRSAGGASNRNASGSGRSGDDDTSPSKATASKSQPPRKAAAKKAQPARNQAPAKSTAARKQAPTERTAARKQAPAKSTAARKQAPAKSTAARKQAPAERTAARKQAPAKRTAKSAGSRGGSRG